MKDIVFSSKGTLKKRDYFRGQPEEIMKELQTEYPNEVFIISRVTDDEFSRVLKKARALHELSGAEAGRVLGISVSMLSRLENGLAPSSKLRYKLLSFINAEY